tara:strand:- start:437 stop:676 length:240 start_codon:yes stop_codon:yes gene_type:complete
MPYLNNHFHIYDHQSEVYFLIIGKSNFMRWLNDHADFERYTFFSTHTKLKKYLKEIDLEGIKEIKEEDLIDNGWQNVRR